MLTCILRLEVKSEPFHLTISSGLLKLSGLLCSGWNHSGRNGPVNFMNGVMGIVNGQRTLNIIRAMAEFVCLPENNDVRDQLICEFTKGITDICIRSFKCLLS